MNLAIVVAGVIFVLAGKMDAGVVWGTIGGITGINILGRKGVDMFGGEK